MSFNSDKIKDLTLNDTTVKVRLNDEKEIVEINELKLIESSLYFENMLSSKYNDHKKEIVEVKYPANIDTFKSAMHFVGTGHLSLDDENFLEILGFADYLQMEKLQKFCLNHFTSKLSRSNVEAKFDMLNKTHLPVEEFKQSTISFIKNSACGLYFTQKEPKEPIRSSLNFFSFENNTFRNISCYRHNRSVSLFLHNFVNTLVVCPARLWHVPSEKTMLYDKTMILYDLITETTKEIALSFEGQSVNCSNENQLFVLSENGSEKKSFSLEAFDVLSLAEFSSTRKTIDYDLVQGYIFETFHYAECVGDKIYIFYRAELEEDSLARNYRMNNIINYMMIICAKTLEIEKNINIADYDLYHGHYITKDSDLWKKMKRSSLYKYFSLRNENKLFIKFDRIPRYVLIFDIETQLFYLEENQFKTINSETECKVDRKIKVFSRGEEYFGLLLTSWMELDSDEDSDDLYSRFHVFPVYNELRSYKVENDFLVEKEVIWKGEASSVRRKATFRDWVNPFSTVVVENIYLD